MLRCKIEKTLQAGNKHCSLLKEHIAFRMNFISSAGRRTSSIFALFSELMFRNACRCLEYTLYNTESNEARTKLDKLAQQREDMNIRQNAVRPGNFEEKTCHLITIFLFVNKIC